MLDKLVNEYMLVHGVSFAIYAAIAGSLYYSIRKGNRKTSQKLAKLEKEIKKAFPELYKDKLIKQKF